MSNSADLDSKNRNTVKVIVASVIGNALEFYDFTLFVFLAPFLAPLFFPSKDPIVSTLAALGTFAVGYVMRPLGAIFFGYIGDMYGRKRALTLAITLMAVPTLIIGLLPTYQDIGLLAPGLLIVCRLLQGLCVGGEYCGAAIFAVENVRQERAGFAGSMVTSSSVLGGLIGSIVAMIVTLPLMPSWAWRWAFILGGIIAYIGFYIRQSLEDRYHPIPQNHSRAPIVDVLKSHLSSVFCTAGIAAFSGIMFYFSFSYISIYLTVFRGWNLPQALIVMGFGSIIYIILSPIIGNIAVKYQDRKILQSGIVATVLMAPLALYMITQSQHYGIILAGQGLLAILAAWFQAPMNVYMARLFSPDLRYTGLAFSYSIGIAVFGGTTSMIATALVQYFDTPMAPLLYVFIGAGLGLWAVIRSRPAPQLIQRKT